MKKSVFLLGLLIGIGAPCLSEGASQENYMGGYPYYSATTASSAEYRFPGTLLAQFNDWNDKNKESYLEAAVTQAKIGEWFRDSLSSADLHVKNSGIQKISSVAKLFHEGVGSSDIRQSIKEQVSIPQLQHLLSILEQPAFRERGTGEEACVEALQTFLEDLKKAKVE